MTVEVQAPTKGASDDGRPRDDVQPVANETRDRIITGTVTIVPILGLGLVGWQLWNSWLHVSDLIVLFICYLLTGLGITVGFHRHLTHRSFKAKTWLHGLLAILGSAAIEGPVISWVADHRKHHAFSDEVGDPHSPHVDHGHGWSGAMRGLFHAHMGWLFIHTQRGNKERYAPDLLKDPVISYVDGTFLIWAIEAGVWMAVGRAAGFPMGPIEGCYLVALASVFALIPSGPGYAGTQDAAAILGIKALGGTGAQAVAYLVLLRFVIVVPITLLGLALMAGRYGGLGRLRRLRRARTA